MAGNNKTYLDLYVQRPIFLSDFIQIRSFSIISSFMEMQPVKVALTHADRRT